MTASLASTASPDPADPKETTACMLMALLAGLAPALGMVASNIALWVCLATILALPGLRRQFVLPSLRPFLKAILLLILVTAAAALIHPHMSVPRKVFTSLHLLMLVPGFLIARSRRSLRLFAGALLLSLSAGLLASLWQLYANLGVAPEAHRPLLGLFSNAITWLGVLLQATLILYILVPQLFPTHTKYRWLLPMVALLVTALFAQRMYLFFLILALPLLLPGWRSKFAYAALTILLVSVLYISNPFFRGRIKAVTDLQYRLGSTRVHLTLARDAVEIWENQPLLGSGPGSFRKHFKQKHPDWVKRKRIYNHAHNQYLQALAETGIAGLLAMLFFFAVILRFLWQNREQPWFRAGVVMTAAMLVVGLTDVPFYDSEVAQTFALGIGLLIGLAESSFIENRAMATKTAQKTPDSSTF